VPAAVLGRDTILRSGYQIHCFLLTRQWRKRPPKNGRENGSLHPGWAIVSFAPLLHSNPTIRSPQGPAFIVGDELEVTESSHPIGSACTQMVTQVMLPGLGEQLHIELD
jgi:hypothetical protein